MSTETTIGRALRGVPLATLAIAALAVIGAAPAGAAFPGQNGQIAYTQLEGFDGQSTIGVVNPDGGGARTLTAAGEGARQPAYSADGRRIVYTAAPGAIVRMLANGERKRRLTPKRRLEDMPSWSPNGRRVAFVRQTRLSREVFTMLGNGRRARPLTRNRASEETPVYSPDGKWIAFVRSGAKGRIVFRMRANGRGARPVAVGSDPAWSPDGRRLAFVRASRTGGSEIFTVRLSGRGAHKVTSGAGTLLQRDLHPEWSPDGKWIAFVRNNEEIRTVRPGGGATQLLAAVPGVGDLSWQSR